MLRGEQISRSEEEEDRARRGDRNADGKTAGRVEQ
jgi:hypothetical protein